MKETPLFKVTSLLYLSTCYPTLLYSLAQFGRNGVGHRLLVLYLDFYLYARGEFEFHQRLDGVGS